MPKDLCQGVFLPCGEWVEERGWGGQEVGVAEEVVQASVG